MTNLTDSQKLKAIIESLGETTNSFANTLQYKSAQSVYHVINGANNLSIGMQNRIVKHFPNVNMNYIKEGKLPVILSGADLQAQINLLSLNENPTQELPLLMKYLEIPDRVKRIEDMLVQVLKLVQQREDKDCP